MTDISRFPALAPFRVRSFRFQWPADLFVSWAFEMETIILGWYVLVETNSVFLLTLFGALQYVGTLVAPALGVASDRIGHRNLLFAMRVIYASSATMLMALAFMGLLTPFAVFIVAAVSGVVRPSDLGVRSALIAELLPTEQLMGAASISRMTWDIARIVGALAGAGLFAALGMGPAYLVITAFYVLGAALTLAVMPRQGGVRAHQGALAGVRPPSPWRDLGDGLRHIRATPSLLAAMWLAFLVNLTAFPFSHGLLPYVAKGIYGIDQTGLGYLVASFALGSLFGSILLSRAGIGPRLPRLAVLSAVGWYAILLVFAFVQSLTGGIVCMLIAGFAQSLCLISLMVLLLRHSGERLRGRVMGVRMLAIYGLPLGLMGAGALVERIGFSATAVAFAFMGAASIVLIARFWRNDIRRIAVDNF
ncbi:MAG: MFS transporter [Proteobacteria bacterium]|nr:MFS transporter [Pseudomonadota bacterium]